MRVFIPSPLRSYTQGASHVEGKGATLGEVIDNLELAHPGLRFRMIDEQGDVRPHIKLFIGQDHRDELGAEIPPGTDVHIIAALSGG